ncbi:4-alpha-glucanotransferase [Lujinxingia sediminis]|uniref:4-alpha-glucanotransferase n=2 Tax=Lujinxingia sediminis TaxID=2480984 RepID=A0ABY0CV86_9DELT|nr:4-alpha-glucanotransferase [Lujinxingia sediminis]
MCAVWEVEVGPAVRGRDDFETGSEMMGAWERSSGVLLHPTSLPGPDGVGCLGRYARRWIERLAEGGQRWWQVLPLNPPGHGGSPYSASSAFAGNPMVIDGEQLVEAGWLSGADLNVYRRVCAAGSTERFDVEVIREAKRELLVQAYEGWKEAGGGSEASFQEFSMASAGWLEDFALYTALKHRHEGRGWQQWPAPLVRRDPEAIAEAQRGLGKALEQVRFEQWVFAEQWAKLKRYAADRGVRVLGDVPIFVAMDSAEVWAERDLFELGADGEPDAVAGVPPDYFSKTGQRWGNPLYAWDRLADRDYDWWVWRVRQVMTMVDAVRVDHFRGFESYWRIDAEAPTAVDGRWEKGPGRAVFEAIEAELGEVPMVAEDLGIITDKVRELRDELGLMGMRVMQFGFDGTEDHPFLPHTYPRHCAAYTGTHDNDTTQGWYEGLDELGKHGVRTYVSHGDEGIVWAMIERLWASKANLVVVPVQDLFELGSEARMNVPGRAEDNWNWRMSEAMLEDETVYVRLGALTRESGR